MVTAFRRSSWRGRLWSVCAGLALAATAQATMISVQVTGVVTHSDFDTIDAGTLVTGLYTYDSALVPIGDASYRPVTATLGFVDGSTISSPLAEIFVHNNGGGTTDEYAVFITGTAGWGTVTGAFATTNWEIATGAILRYDPTGTAWDSTALPDPETVLALLPNDSSTVYFFETTYGVSRSVDFRTTDLSVVAIPLPGALALGLMGVGICHRLRRRRTI